MKGPTHAVLTDGSLSPPTGKGREGKGRGRELRDETPHHGVTYVTRGAHDAMMSEAQQ